MIGMTKGIFLDAPFSPQFFGKKMFRRLRKLFEEPTPGKKNEYFLEA